MSRKPKFKPEIARVKLNPEQAVLSCGCHGSHPGINNVYTAKSAKVSTPLANMCILGGKTVLHSFVSGRCNSSLIFDAYQSNHSGSS